MYWWIFTLARSPARMVIVSGSSEGDLPDMGESIHRSVRKLATKKLPIYCSRERDPEAFATDSLSISWRGMEGYAYPPEPLIRQVLQKVRRDESRMILIAPNWGRQPWMSLLIDLLVDIPRQLRVKRKLLKHPGQQTYHPNPEILNLFAWRIRGLTSERKAFEEKLGSWQQVTLDQQRARNMDTKYKNSLVGVTRNGLSIPGVPL